MRSFLFHASTLIWYTTNKHSVNFSLITAKTLDTPLRVVKKNSFFTTTSTINNLVLNHLRTFTPIFSFFIQNLSKFQRKHTRGKKEKLRIMWKYLPPYKRFFQTMKWLFKDLKFNWAQGQFWARAQFRARVHFGPGPNLGPTPNFWARAQFWAWAHFGPGPNAGSRPKIGRGPN